MARVLGPGVTAVPISTWNVTQLLFLLVRHSCEVKGRCQVVGQLHPAWVTWEKVLTRPTLGYVISKAGTVTLPSHLEHYCEGGLDELSNKKTAAEKYKRARLPGAQNSLW